MQAVFFFSYIHSLLLYIEGIQNKPLWHKKLFWAEDLCVAEIPYLPKSRASPKEPSCHKSPPGSNANFFLETRSQYCTQADIVTKPSYLPSILLKPIYLLKSHLFFHKWPFSSPSKESFVLPKVPLCSSPPPLKMVYKPQIRLLKSHFFVNSVVYTCN